MDLLSYDSWDASLKAAGYSLAQTSRYGSRLYANPGHQLHRVAANPPNMATAAWMARNNVIDHLAIATDAVPKMGELPEFGLEATDAYHSDVSAISKSMLSDFMDSALDYYHIYITGLKPRKKPTRKMKIGTICHAMLLEHKTLDEACIVYPYSCIDTSGKLKSKKAAEFEASVPNRVAVKEDFIPVIEATIKNARASEFGSLLDLHMDNAKFETRIDEELYGLPCKCRPDIHILLKDQIVVPDLKFGVVKPDDFWRNANGRFRYWLQQAHYSAILTKRYGLPVNWTFWAFETEFPYRVKPYWYDARSAEIASEQHKVEIRKLKQCYDTNKWDDDFSSEGMLNPWNITQEGRTESAEESTDPVPFQDTDYDDITDVDL